MRSCTQIHTHTHTHHTHSQTRNPDHPTRRIGDIIVAAEEVNSEAANSIVTYVD
jgi:hypothetical protein